MRSLTRLAKADSRLIPNSALDDSALDPDWDE